jgi:hypothetical protein
MIDREKRMHVEPPIANEYVKRIKPLILDDYMWAISYDILCILYGELNASKPHKIMGIQVYADKGMTRFIMLRENDVAIDSRGNFYFKNNLSDKETLYVKNDIEALKTAFNSTYGISNAKPKIKKVIFNDPATIIFWNDGTKTVVKANDEQFDPEKGMAMAISKKMLGNEGCYYETFKKWLPKEKDSNEYMDLPIFSEEDRFSTTKQVAEITGQSVKTIQKRCREGSYPGAIKVNNEWYIPFSRTKGGNHNE